VTEKTLNNWKCEHESFLQSIKEEAKEVFDAAAVEKALHQGCQRQVGPCPRADLMSPPHAVIGMNTSPLRCAAGS